MLLVGFNRPERLAGLIERLRIVRPERVYVAVDGPRPHVPTDTDRVLRTRAAADAIDWTHEVRTLFRDDNVGCGRGVSGAVDWLFAHEERGIVLEDDLLPSPSFFPFCAELLDRYSDDDRVWAVSGCNFVPPDEIGTDASYRFTTVPHVWGWATWRRAWSAYRFDLGPWHDRRSMAATWRAARTPAAWAHWAALFELTSRGRIDTWDYQTALAAFRAGALTATSNVNLVENVGFGTESTHTQGRPTYLRAVEAMSFPMAHPAEVIADHQSEHWTRRHVLHATPRGLASQARRLLWPPSS